MHHLTAEGKHIHSWGESGTDAGQFNIPHNIAMHPDNDKVIVIDRENSRAQLFTLDGTFVELWPIHRAVSVVCGQINDGTGEAKVLIAEQGSTSRVQKGAGFQISDLDTWTPNIGQSVCTCTPELALLPSL